MSGETCPQTGLLGINVGGVSGENLPWSFASVALSLVVQKLKWIQPRRFNNSGKAPDHCHLTGCTPLRVFQ
jgi:hypothetical protein